MKKLFSTLFSIIKWTAFLLGLPIILWLGYSLYRSFGSSSIDVSKTDIDFKFKLKETVQPDKLPNILLINADDLGYGDLGCYGGQSMNTPNIDKIAANGMRFTNNYASCSICSPSRAGLLTGRYPIRAGFTSIIVPSDYDFSKKFVTEFGKIFNLLGGSDHGRESFNNGLPHKEITIPEALKQRGYATGMAGKWHLGDMKDKEEFNPMYHGFDDFLGINAANDEFPVSLIDQHRVIDGNIRENQEVFTRLFAGRTIDFISKNKEKPFFYYLAFTAAHEPLAPSADFKGKSKGGIYGDVVEEMDFYVGKILESLEKQGLSDNTIVIFTSDNGPWWQGSAGGLRGRKGQSYDGGYKVPFIISWKNHIAPNSVADTRVMNIDLFPTILSWVGLENPTDRIIDGKNLSDIVFGKSTKPIHDKMFFYHYDKPEAIIAGDWKYFDNVHHYTWPTPLEGKGTVIHQLTMPIFLKERIANLYDLARDPFESYDVRDNNMQKADSLKQVMESWKVEIEKNREGWIK